jgi:hypothetical protein
VNDHPSPAHKDHGTPCWETTGTQPMNRQTNKREKQKKKSNHTRNKDLRGLARIAYVHGRTETLLFDFEMPYKGQMALFK